VLELNVAVGALEAALVVEGELLGDEQVTVLSQPQRDVGVDDLRAARQRRLGDRQRRRDGGEGEGAVKPATRATISAGNTWTTA
jgi:hypothetical protein